jgi:hypothetical protein
VNYKTITIAKNIGVIFLLLLLSSGVVASLVHDRNINKRLKVTENLMYDYRTTALITFSVLKGGKDARIQDINNGLVDLERVYANLTGETNMLRWMENKDGRVN